MRDLSAIDISDFLPHRPPFLLVDKVLELDDTSVSTSLKIKRNCLFVKNNKFDEVGLVEFAAQTCSAIVGKDYFDEDDIKGKGNKLIGFISSVKKLTIFDCPSLDSTIIAKAKLISSYDNGSFSLSTLSCRIYEDSKELLSCELNLIIQEANQIQ